MRTMKTTTRLWTSLFTILLAAACDPPAESGEDFGDGNDVTERCVSCGGIRLNTNKLGTFPFAVLDTTGAYWDGIKLGSVTSPELGVVDSVFVKQGVLYAKKSGKTWPDKYLLNSLWKVYVKDGGNTYTGSMQLKAFGSDNGNRTYTFWSNYSGPGGNKELMPNCDDDPAEPGDQIAAILSADIVVDPESAVVKKEENKIYIGCLSGGVGKAAKWGYPSHKHTEIEFETAVRVVRADYCGNGFSFTKPGNAIQLADIFGVSDFGSPGSKNEAIWDKTGAFCVDAPRWSSEYPDAKSVQKVCEELGAEPPKVCDVDVDLGATGDAMFWSKLP